MATLHLLAAADAAASCLAALAPGDSLLLIGDGVFAQPAQTPVDARVGILGDDAARRGVVPRDGVRQLSYEDFVAWAVACERSVTWR